MQFLIFWYKYLICIWSTCLTVSNYYFCTYLSGQTFTYVPVSLSTFPYVYLFTCPPFYMTTFLHFYLYTCQLVYISTCLQVKLSTCQLAYRFTCSPGLPVYQPTTKLAYQYTSLIPVYLFSLLPVICVSIFLSLYKSILIIFNNHFRTRNVFFFLFFCNSKIIESVFART